MDKAVEIPEDVLKKHQDEVCEIKLRAFSMAHMIEQMEPDERKHSGYRGGGHVILEAAKEIEKKTRALKKRYPMGKD